MIDNAAPAGAQPSRPGRGCFFYGCLGSIIVLIIGSLALSAVTYFFYSKIDQVIDAAIPFTDSQAQPVPASGASAAEYQAVQERLDAFSRAVELGGSASLALSAREINALIENNSELEPLRGRVSVEINDSEIGGRIALPLNFLPVERLQQRFINGSAKFSITTNPAGQVELRLRDLEVKGKVLPADILTPLTSKNLLDQARQNPKMAERLARLKSARIENGQLVIEAR